MASDLEQKIAKYPQLYYLFSESLKDHIGNCLEHEKMLPLFLERGFKREDFVGDYESRIMDVEELKELQQNFLKDEIYSRKTIDIYLGKFFSMKSTSNEQQDYHKYFEALKELDTSLYEVLDGFWNNWSRYEIGSVDGFEYFLDAFLHKLNNWMQEKVVI